jgi:hypothetical protein
MMRTSGHRRTRTRATAATLALALAGALAGCAIGGKTSPPPAEPPTAEPPATTPPPTATPAPGSTPGGVPRASGPISAPWDTAAQSRETRRNHVYPEGETEVSRRLLASIPEPSTRGTSSSGSSSPAPPPATGGTSTPAPAPVNPADCWEVQILTTIDRDKAVQLRDEAERKLNVASWVRSYGGVHRVRLGGCLTMDGAAELAERVRRNGYPEAFRTRRDP